jgi:hypothetical protein
MHVITPDHYCTLGKSFTIVVINIHANRYHAALPFPSAAVPFHKVIVELFNLCDVFLDAWAQSGHTQMIRILLLTESRPCHGTDTRSVCRDALVSKSATPLGPCSSLTQKLQRVHHVRRLALLLCSVNSTLWHFYPWEEVHCSLSRLT